MPLINTTIFFILMSNMNKSVPTGWKKGEPITIEAWLHGRETRLRISRPISFNFDETISADEIYCIYHSNFEEHCEFIKWWFS